VQLDPEFKPELTPKQMLELGVFDGAYFDDYSEFPVEWTENVAKKNFFGVHASQSLAEWQRKGWLFPEDPLGWFQWYCRYTMGRRVPEMDAVQIKRWKAMTRHIAQIKQNCMVGDVNCRPRQRQALLHWAYDSRKI
jgi:hypothetical protein